MIQKIIGYQNDSAAKPDHLVLELGAKHLACMSSSEGADTLTGFELFSIEKNGEGWNEAWKLIDESSKLLGADYASTKICFNYDESLLLPAQHFSAGSAVNHLSLVYGENAEQQMLHDTIASTPLVNAYRIPKKLKQTLDERFPNHQSAHSFSSLLTDVLDRNGLPAQFLKLQVYTGHFILAYCKNRKLQLIRSFAYQTGEDIIYWLTSVAQQFSILQKQSEIEISGMLHAELLSQKQLLSLFGHISFEEIVTDPGFVSAVSIYPPYYFSPFHKAGL
jgi:hypothetical protein